MDKNVKNKSLKVRLRAFNIHRLHHSSPIVLHSNEEVQCKNCGHLFIGNFCPLCGQDATVGSLRAIDIPKNIFGAFFNIDGGFGSTLLQLFTRPGYLIRDYLQGKRVRYFRPFQTLFVLAAIYILVALVFNPEALTGSDKLSISFLSLETDIRLVDDSADSSSTAVLPEVMDGAQVESMPGLLSNTLSMLKGLYYDSKVFKIVLTIIIMALANMIVFNKKATGVRYNYVEHVFAMTYIGAQLLLLSILLLPFNSDATITSDYELPFVFIVAIYCYDFKQLYGMTWLKTILRTLLAVVIQTLLSILVAMMIALFEMLMVYLR